MLAHVGLQVQYVHERVGWGWGWGAEHSQLLLSAELGMYRTRCHVSHSCLLTALLAAAALLSGAADQTPMDMVAVTGPQHRCVAADVTTGPSLTTGTLHCPARHLAAGTVFPAVAANDCNADCDT